MGHTGQVGVDQCLGPDTDEHVAFAARARDPEANVCVEGIDELVRRPGIGGEVDVLGGDRDRRRLETVDARLEEAVVVAAGRVSKAKHRAADQCTDSGQDEDDAQDEGDDASGLHVFRR